MRIYLFLAVFVLAAFTENGTARSKYPMQSENVSIVPVGKYVWDSKTEEVWNDSVRVYSDTLIVYKDPSYGYGRIISFTYQFEELNEHTILLYALSMDPEGVFVLPEQYEWHLDTLKFKFSQSDNAILIGPNKEEYKLNTTKPKLH